ncbi:MULTISPECIES: DNA replication/repair protein RecF [unclassified Gemella]|uniref:DNA replication/repair protein RecF n=1 Tax=unclassified Gemella TaxID=2624949 RepID=UPI00107344A2|nr:MULTISPECIES: DNA replication/repair protein RecF [unclassified Gemella]MBF0709623.1 DNA replication/repair protein RecF [Gemella sp. GL1.1]MBF0746958.1 DNA replication/repair protein RecF [Gemella sp. 19428wG2_WT2a]NYS26967.1 DNA replication/repair protein RecF [Gemella sp. GL1]TFU59183.1 DNA replication/repair protein RecF [Gemella sp. WT2a]
MKIKNLNLLYFRNYTSLNLDLHPSLNILVGNNANGKTNIIESIFYLALARSFRTRRDSETIQFGQEAACISCELVKNNNHVDIMLAMNDKGKNAKIAGSKKSKLTDFVGELNVVLFSPDDLQLVKGSPSFRREFIDREFYQFSRIYHKYSLMYKHILKQRNTFLKDMRKNRNDEMSRIYLEEVTFQLAKLALFITRQRFKFVKQIASYAQKSMNNISDGKEKLDIFYKSSILENMKEDKLLLEDIDEKYVADLIMKKMNEDINNGSTRIGIHQDDLIFYINSLDAKIYASQGQQRSIVLSLRLAELDFLKKETGFYPILLLDDVLSELDKTRQFKLLDAIDSNIQTFITAPSISDIKESLVKNAKVFYINQGIVEISK